MQKRSVSRKVFLEDTTYLAKIAAVLQNAPDKMLTFAQLMAEMVALVPEEKKSVENNIRVCLSTNRCFRKIPVVPGSSLSKRNYWKLDCSQITAKMVRRHFKEMLHLFPELSSKVNTENESKEEQSSPSNPEPATDTTPVRHELKFNSPFSIESLLKRDSPPRRPRSSPLSSVQVKKEQPSEAGIRRRSNWDANYSQGQSSASSSSVCSLEGSKHHRLIIPGCAEPSRRVLGYSHSSFPLYSAPPCYITYTLHDHHALRF